MFFAAGIGTVLQTAIGSRLPILEGASFTFVTPAIALLTSSNYECLHPAEDESEEDIWQSRMQILQGGLIIASVVQVQGFQNAKAKRADTTLIGLFGVQILDRICFVYEYPN